jgi:putative methyltransferase (TIGR01177 family)
LKNRSLVLLSGEGTSLPPAEAKALFLAYDPESKFESPEPRVIIADSRTDPFVVASRIAFSRRVGPLIGSPREAADAVRGKRVRFRSFDLIDGLPPVDPVARMRGIRAKIDLGNPEYEVTLIRGKEEHFALTRPFGMRQSWSKRKPRSRAFFHPSAIFPKLSRALVNLSRIKEGQVFLDPFSGTGSLPIEAAGIGAQVVASDQVAKMVRGSIANMRHFKQEWLGVIRADAFLYPVTRVDAIATDVPYGRVSSTRGSAQRDIIDRALAAMASMLEKDSRIVLMHSRQARVRKTKGMVVEGEVDLYVHKLLTRTITVLRRS